MICVKDPKVDKFVSGGIIKTGCWEKHIVVDAMRSVDNYPSAVFLDIGANIGDTYFTTHCIIQVYGGISRQRITQIPHQLLVKHTENNQLIFGNLLFILPVVMIFIFSHEVFLLARSRLVTMFNVNR